MKSAQTVRITSRDGLQGTVDAPIEFGDAAQSQVQVEMDNGAQILVPADLLERQEDGNYYLPLDLASRKQDSQAEGRSALVLPVIAEELDVSRRRVRTGGVRVSKHVREREEIVDEPGFEEEVDIERVPVNRVLDEPVSTRTEGDILVVPVLEEVIVVEKRLMLKEEIRITRRRTEIHQPQRVTLKSEEVTIENSKTPADHDEDGDYAPKESGQASKSSM